MPTPESRVKKKAKELLANYPAYGNWPVPGGYGESQLDYVGCLFGKFFAIETKALGQKLTPRQAFIAEQIREAGGKVFVLEGLDDYEWLALRSWLDDTTAMGLMTKGTPAAGLVP